MFQDFPWLWEPSLDVLKEVKILDHKKSDTLIAPL